MLSAALGPILTVVIEHRQWIAHIGPLGWAGVAVALLPAIPLSIWSKTGSGPGAVVAAAVSGVSMLIGFTMISVDLGDAGRTFRNRLLLLGIAGILLLFTIGLYLRLRRDERGRT